MMLVTLPPVPEYSDHELLRQWTRCAANLTAPMSAQDRTSGGTCKA